MKMYLNLLEVDTASVDDTEKYVEMLPIFVDSNVLTLKK